MLVSVQALGEELLGPSRAAVAAFLIGLLLTFLGIRMNTRLIRAQKSWWFHDIESGGGVHVHHMVIGVVLMVVSGILLIGLLPQGLWLQIVALFFGGGVALTLDEFALILRLQDVYWTDEGRLSVNAVFIAVCGAGLLLLNVRPVVLDQTTADESALVAVLVISGTIIINFGLSLICLLKGKLWAGFFGLFIPLFGAVGAIRLARPTSPWARRRYRNKPARMKRAEHRERRRNATVDAWRTAFFNLVAGKPHMPTVVPPEEAADVADDAAAAPAEGVAAPAAGAVSAAAAPAEGVAETEAAAAPAEGADSAAGRAEDAAAATPEAEDSAATAAQTADAAAQTADSAAGRAEDAGNAGAPGRSAVDQ